MTRTEILKTAKPILFSTEMVREIQDGRKTVTRKPIKDKKYIPDDVKWGYTAFTPEKHISCRGTFFDENGDKRYGESFIKVPYKVGDILYVRETWCKYSKLEDDMVTTIDGAERYYYRADGENPTDFNTFLVQKDGYDEYEDYPKWRHSIHMPKEAARIFLQVTDVRVERLQDISDKDFIREGIEPYIHIDGSFNREATQTAYVGIWNSTVKKSDLSKYGWDANPWVWVIEFERVEVQNG